MAYSLASAQEIIEEIRQGRMVVLVDDENRENEGDLIIPAQMANAEAINFMAKFGRGLICLCLTETRVRELGLAPMVQNNGTRHGTAFTPSINAAQSDHNPVSAQGRAHTIAVAIDEANGPGAITTGGHVFPLISRDGGVLVRTGHTEAAVDLSRLAGLHPSSVICEVMNVDGTMARLDDLVKFCKRHDLKLGTIRDLVLYRRRHDRLLEKLHETRVETNHFGAWTSVVYRNKIDKTEVTALIKGRVDAGQPTLVRMHVPDVLHDLFDVRGPRSGLIAASMRHIYEAGNGIIVLVGPASLQSLANFFAISEGREATRSEVLRDFGVGAEILADLGVHDMILLSNSHVEPVGLEGYGLRIVKERPIDAG